MNKLYLFFLWFFLLGFTSHGYAEQYYFAEIEQADKSERVKMACESYYGSFAQSDSTIVVHSLDKLAAFAQNENDKELEILTTLFKGELLFNHINKQCAVYFSKALVQSQKLEFKNLEAQAYHDLGLQYYRDSKFNLAFEYLLKSNYIIKDIGYATYPAITRYLFELANVYYQFGDYEKCKKLLEEALHYPFANAKYGITIHNTLGLCYRASNDFDSAIEQFKKTMALSKEAREDVWVGIGTGNLGSIYYKRKQYDLALPLFEIDYSISIRDKEYRSAILSICTMADIYLHKNNIDSAQYYLSKGVGLVDIVHDPYTYQAFHAQLARFYQYKGDYSKAYKSLDSANYYSNELTKRDFANIRSKAEQKIAIEKHLTDLDLLESKKQLQIFTRNSIIIGLMMVLIIAGLLLHKQKIKQRHDKLQLENAKDQLSIYMEKLMEKNRLIFQFESDLKNLENTHTEQDEVITKLQNYTILTEDDWFEFRRLFEKVHVGFFTRLKQHHPELTQSEVRLMSLIRLNLSRKEMADMLGISPDSVKKTRQRIKKRITLAENMDLEEIVFGL
jgi:tetratricopeptide (TPR) repeat protein